MDECTIHDRHRFKEVGENLAQVVTVLEWSDSRKDNVYFHEKLVARMVGSKVLNLANGRGKAHGQVEQQISLIGLGRESRQITDVMRRSPTPHQDDDKGEKQAAGGIEPPYTAIEPD